MSVIMIIFLIPIHCQRTHLVAESLEGIASLLRSSGVTVSHERKDVGEGCTRMVANVWLAVLCQLPKSKRSLAPHSRYCILHALRDHLSFTHELIEQHSNSRAP